MKKASASKSLTKYFHSHSRLPGPTVYMLDRRQPTIPQLAVGQVLTRGE
jgi:hypothetical protein